MCLCDSWLYWGCVCVCVCDDALSRWKMGSGGNGSEAGRVASLHIVIMYGKQREKYIVL